MWVLWFWTMVIAIVIGLIAKYGFDYENLPYVSREGHIQISWGEFAAVVVIIGIVVVPLTTAVGLKMAKASKLTYHEFWGGYETAVGQSSRECHRDGSCQDTYDCDPYEVAYQVTDYDDKGNPSGSHTEYRTEYHSCPVATRENYWAIDTTLGKFDLGMTFDQNAVAWRDRHGLDGTPQGPPALWSAAQKRLAAGDPGPVTSDKTYQNYILASTRTILHKFSDAVDKYQKDGLLPYPVTPLGHPIHDYYSADKMQFVKLRGYDEGAWQFALARLNAALGTGLQGDLHVVAINADTVTNVDEYTGALNAYWQGKELGRRALSKNGIGLVLGVKGSTITWARAFTGMPVGNEGLNLDLRNGLEVQPFNPSIFGHPTVTTVKEKIKVTPDLTSPVEAALWGPHKFERVCMVCKGEGKTGYKYLGSEIQPSQNQKLIIILVSTIFAILIWGIALLTVVGETTERETL